LYEIYSRINNKVFKNLYLSQFNNSFISFEFKTIKSLNKYYINRKKINKNISTMVNIFKPKNQFFASLNNGKNYIYSTGLIIKSIGNESRASRRNKIGFNIFFLFLIKKISYFKSTNNVFIRVKGLNNYLNVKGMIFDFISSLKCNVTLAIMVKKNYTKHNYKKLSYINKRLRRKFIVE